MVTTITAIGVLSMFLPPFGMLLGKWLALESASVIPLAAWLFVFASAATIVFWAKWLGRLLQVLPKLGSKIESLSLSYTVPLWVLVLGIFGVGIGVAPILHGIRSECRSRRDHLRAVCGCPGMGSCCQWSFCRLLDSELCGRQLSGLAVVHRVRHCHADPVHLCRHQAG